MADGDDGYPIVDAGMRQLLAKGWTRNPGPEANRELPTDLHVRRAGRCGASPQKLVDGEIASINTARQWVAGTCTDTSPYFRVLNRCRRARGSPPSADYVLQWVARLGHLAAKTLRQTWEHADG